MAGTSAPPEILEEPVRVTPTAIGEIHRTALETQIARADVRPRNIARFLDKSQAMACANEEIAAGCIFAIPRGGKPIEGPSIRLAEIIQLNWTNLNVGTRVINTDRTTITAQGVVYDCESNVSISKEVQRRITDKHGNRFSEDMIVMTGNAAASIAQRNAIFSIVPKVYVEQLYLAARQVAIGSAETLAARRAQLVEYFGKMGVQPEDVARVAGHSMVDEITLKDMALLRGIATAIKDGTISVDEAFAPPDEDNGRPAHGVAGLKERLKNGKKTPASTPASSNATESDEARGADEGKAAYAEQLAKLRQQARDAYNVIPKPYWRAALRKVSLEDIEAVDAIENQQQLEQIIEGLKSFAKEPQPAPA